MSKGVIQAANVACAMVLAGYLVAEYVMPYVKRRWFTRSLIRAKLQLEEDVRLNQWEETIALDAVHPDEIATDFRAIGGHENIIRQLQANIAALTSPNPPKSRLAKAPSGVLLYGPPGCGKTLLARALAKASGARFINVNLATIFDKWVGETEKYVEAIFTLAQKIQPAIIFVDEVEALCRKRNSMDRDWDASRKAQMLSLWDGINIRQDRRVMVLGATNRRQDIDDAFLRRMPLQIRVGLPDLAARVAILQILLEDFGHSEDLELVELAKFTQGYSGSDLHELCRRVALEAYLQRPSGHGDPSPIRVGTEAFLRAATEMSTIDSTIDN